jgi:hypothetical protein
VQKRQNCVNQEKISAFDAKITHYRCRVPKTAGIPKMEPTTVPNCNKMSVVIPMAPRERFGLHSARKMTAIPRLKPRPNLARANNSKLFT